MRTLRANCRTSQRPNPAEESRLTLDPSGRSALLDEPGVVDDEDTAVLAKRVGNIVAGAQLLERTPDAMQELDMALELFGPMRLRHEVTPYLQRSYYASARGDRAWRA